VVTEEVFFAWLDGELDADEAERVAAEVEADENLALRAEEHRALQRRLGTAFGTVLSDPLPEAVLAAARPEPEVVDLAAARRERQPRRWSGLPQWAAIAATLAIGVFAGTMVPHRDDDPVRIEGGKVYAAASLDRALTTQLASAPAGDTRIGLTFRDQDGAMCRTFTQPAASGLACRDGQRWRLRGFLAAPEVQAGTYRMASGMDPNLANLVGTAMAGEPFDAAQEKAARDKGWR
jgi:hypothetical protein